MLSQISSAAPHSDKHVRDTGGQLGGVVTWSTSRPSPRGHLLGDIVPYTVAEYHNTIMGGGGQVRT